jgi:uncharacterized repeat protein (TIGR04042 family)
MTFTVRWPDGATQQCYSPSLVMHDFLVDQTDYPIDDFMARSTKALNQASERVRAKFGFACTSAAASIAALVQSRARYGPGDQGDQGTVTVVGMAPGREALS